MWWEQKRPGGLMWGVDWISYTQLKLHLKSLAKKKKIKNLFGCHEVIKFLRDQPIKSYIHWIFIFLLEIMFQQN